MLAIFAINNSSFAQDNKDVYQWLSSNISRLDHVNCSTKSLFGDQFEISEQGLHLFDNFNSCEIKWVDIKSIEQTDDFIFVISEETYDNAPIVLKFYIKNEINKIHFISGFKHIAYRKSKSYSKSTI